MNNKGTDQSAGMRRLICAFIVCKPRRKVSRVKANITLDLFSALKLMSYCHPQVGGNYY